MAKSGKKREQLSVNANADYAELSKDAQKIRDHLKDVPLGAENRPVRQGIRGEPKMGEPVKGLTPAWKQR